ncbi:SepF-like predicted cell division protein (DUF552 family) [Aquimarina sp. EL_43]|uniref:hypothetical protein n=1 Tax=Aquimarina TaxID=290174 RepID=UPI00046E9356|nr:MULTISPECIES: hypothetical protein [Aquimarina]MBG6130740.1 SepF-like predicted cell division protein (DUF552 family) [Aquimarina sp. EL_35]MBG6151113.1 SepF-like predicted cell division protein (DUF552 family) [Aquimarina sp. EL_32]MBG6169130.1 SepF-like predicted cell division protein (DUF552 family) [Aquimarina sp. EL_43]
MKNLIVIFLLALHIGCNSQNKNMKETPLVSVIKLKSAEAVLNFEEAKKYIDLDKVFEKSPELRDVEKQWKEMVTLFYNLGNDKKFTNHFKYFNYRISEVVKQSKAEVIFAKINKESQVKEIVYSLENREENWVVVDIEYTN